MTKVKADVDKLVTTGFIREVQYPVWLANRFEFALTFEMITKLVKGDFPVPNMELLDAATGYEALSFIDEYSEYNQIKMHLDDLKMTTFRSPKCVFCCQVIPFGVNNVGATYQRAMTIIFKEMLEI